MRFQFQVRTQSHVMLTDVSEFNSTAQARDSTGAEEAFTSEGHVNRSDQRNTNLYRNQGLVLVSGRSVLRQRLSFLQTIGLFSKDPSNYIIAQMCIRRPTALGLLS